MARSAATLRRWIGGREVSAARARDLDLTGLVGATVAEVEARAKHLLIRFSGGAVLHTHLGMTGSWHVYPTGERWARPTRQARLVVETGARLAVGFNVPVVELLDAAAERIHPGLTRLGPDVMAPGGIDGTTIARRASTRAEVAPTVGELLLDQQVVSGIGNIYRAETLFLCGVHPRMPSAGIDPGVLETLVATASELMVANATASMADRSFGAGADRPWVYGRAGRPCRRCGTPVAAERLGAQARTVYWCPSCQARPPLYQGTP